MNEKTVNEQDVQKIRETAIEHIAELLRTTPFTFTFEVKKNPKGIRIIQEVTQEQMNAMVEAQVK